MTETETPAGFASRFVAFVTDAVALGVASALVAWTTVQVASLLVSPRFGDRLAPYVTGVGGALVSMGYNVVSWSAFGKTPGKAFLGLRVATLEGDRPSVLRSLARFGGYLLSAIPLGAGFFWILFDEHRRGWHDHLAGTAVVYDGGVLDSSRDGSFRPLLAGRDLPRAEHESGGDLGHAHQEQ